MHWICWVAGSRYQFFRLSTTLTGPPTEQFVLCSPVEFANRYHRNSIGQLMGHVNLSSSKHQNQFLFSSQENHMEEDLWNFSVHTVIDVSTHLATLNVMLWVTVLNDHFDVMFVIRVSFKLGILDVTWPLIPEISHLGARSARSHLEAVLKWRPMWTTFTKVSSLIFVLSTSKMTLPLLQ